MSIIPLTEIVAVATISRNFSSVQKVVSFGDINQNGRFTLDFMFEFNRSNEMSLMGRLMNNRVPINMLYTQVGQRHETPDAYSLSGVRFIRVLVFRCWKMAARSTGTLCFLLVILCNFWEKFCLWPSRAAWITSNRFNR